MKLRRILKWLLYSVAAVVCLLLVLILGVKIALNRAPEYQSQLKAWVHERTGLHIRFAAITPSLRWYGPELRFERLELRSGDDRLSLATAHSGSVALDVWTLIANYRLFAGRIRLDAPQITITRLGPHRFSLGSGVEFGDGQGDLRDTLRRLPPGRLDIRDARVTLLQWNASSPALHFAAVDVDLTRAGDRVDVQLDTTMPAQLSGKVRLRLGVASFNDPGELDWVAGLRAREVSLPGWHDLLPEYSNLVQSGIAGLDLTAAGKGAGSFQASLEFVARNFRAGAAPGAAAAPSRMLREVGGIFTLRRDADRWSLAGRRVRAEAADRAGPPTQFSASWQAGETLSALNAQFDYINLDALTPVVAVLPQRALRESIASYDASGEWRDARLTFTAATATAPARWQARARFSAAGIAPLGPAPGLKHVSGSFHGDERGGRLDLDAPGAIASWPAQWTAPVRFDTLRGSFYWQRSADVLLVASQNIEIANRDFRAGVKLAWRGFGSERSPELTLAGAVSDIDVTAAPRYLPRQKLAPPALAWLDRAFIAGRIPHATVVLRGPLHSFPFRDGSGLFLARFPAENLTLDYRESWPRVENLSLDAEFRNQGLHVDVRHARVGDVQVQEAHADFLDFKDAELKVHAQARTDASSALKLLAATPLDDLAGNAFSKTEAAGPLEGTVEMFLPFKQFDQRHVLTQVQLSGVSASYKGSKAVATQLQGSLTVDNAQVPKAQLRGQMLGGALQVRARAPRGKSDLATQLELRGTMTAEGLRAAFDLANDFSLAGRADWHGTVRLAPLPARERWVRWRSTLEGLAIDLPEPASKAAALAWPAYFQVEWLKAPGPTLHAGITPLGSALIQWDAANRLERSAVAFGTSAPVLSGRDLLAVSGAVDKLDLSGWLARRSAAAGAPLTEWLQSASLGVGELDFHALAFHGLHLELRSAERAWEVQVSGPDTQGTVSLPRTDSAAPWNFAFSRLKIEDRSPEGADPAPPSTAAPRGRVPPVGPGSVPALHFSVGQLAWGSQSIGAVEARLSRVEDGVMLDQGKVTSPSFNLEATGSWRGPEAGRGRLEGLLVSNNVQATLAQFGYADVVQGKAGRLDFDLNWSGIPSSAAIAGLNGRISLQASKGQIIELNPGAGRMLGLASVATLPRRLFLDFSDLTDKGFAYDTIRGDFELRNGDAYTSNFLLEGPAAEIGLVGRVGLAKHDLDQTAVVAGNFGNSLPLASTIAAGPVVGAAVLLFSQVFKQPLKGLARGYYRISGPWDNPVVERVKSDEAAAASKREPPAEQH